MIEFVTISTVLFFLLAFMWNRDDHFNFICKMIFSVMTVAGAFHWFQLAGFVVKI